MNQANNDPDMTAKVFIVGEFAVGKTNLLVRYCEGTFFGQGQRNFEQKRRIETVQGSRIRLVIWDTAEQERYKTVSSSLYRGSLGIIFCYAVNSRESFDKLDYWMDQVNQHGGAGACKILIATKCDLVDHTVTADEGRRKAAAWGVEFFETSASLDLNVAQAIQDLATQIRVRHLNVQAGNAANNNIALNNNNNNNESGCCSGS